jgi:hypothetical protein
MIQNTATLQHLASQANFSRCFGLDLSVFLPLYDIPALSPCAGSLIGDFNLEPASKYCYLIDKDQ